MIMDGVDDKENLSAPQPTPFYSVRIIFVTFLESVSKVLPVILLFLLGMLLNRRQFMRPDTMADLKNLVIKITLPAALFLAFSRVSLEPRHLIIAVVMFGACVLALLVGRIIRPIVQVPSPYFPMLLTGFEAGMMGYAIYATVYGAENLYKFGIVDLGQVIFVFFVLVGALEKQAALERQASVSKPLKETLLAFLKTPVIIGILGGIVANQTGLMALLDSSPIMTGVLRTVELVAGLTTPLIALIIGYEMQLQRDRLGAPFKTIGVRLLYWLPIGLLISVVLIDQVLQLDRGFQAAVLTMIILPPPFVIPLFIPEADRSNRTYVVNTLSLATVVTLFAFAIVTMIYPP
jgi:malate permease and related proteins